jgi:hypothetical protein
VCGFRCVLQRMGSPDLYTIHHSSPSKGIQGLDSLHMESRGPVWCIGLGCLEEMPAVFKLMGKKLEGASSNPYVELFYAVKNSRPLYFGATRSKEELGGCINAPTRNAKFHPHVPMLLSQEEHGNVWGELRFPSWCITASS